MLSHVADLYATRELSGKSLLLLGEPPKLYPSQEFANIVPRFGRKSQKSYLIMTSHSFQRFPRPIWGGRPTHPLTNASVLQEAFSVTSPGKETDLLRRARHAIGSARGRYSSKILMFRADQARKEEIEGWRGDMGERGRGWKAFSNKQQCSRSSDAKISIDTDTVDIIKISLINLS